MFLQENYIKFVGLLNLRANKGIFKASSLCIYSMLQKIILFRI